jgi:transposase
MFAHKIRLKLDKPTSDIIDKRMNVCRLIDNLFIGEMFRRVGLRNQSKTWQNGIALKHLGRKKKEGNLLLSEASKKYACNIGYSYLLNGFGNKEFAHSWHLQHIAKTIVGLRGQNIVGNFKKWLIDHKGNPKKGKPRFNRFGDCRTVYGSLATSKKTSGKIILFNKDNGQIIWGGRGVDKISLDCIIDPGDKNTQLALNSTIKRVGITKENNKYYGILICDTDPLVKGKYSPKTNNIVSFDIGIKDIAIVTSDGKTYKLPLLEGLKDSARELNILARTIERRRRMANPQNYNENGTIKRGIRLTWNKTNNYLSALKKYKNLAYKQQQTRKNLHNNLIHWMMGLGNTFHFEKIDYRTWAKGLNKTQRRNMGLFSPGLFISLLKYNVLKYGLKIDEFSTYSTACSKTCICGEKHNKKDDIYICPVCGLAIDRDIKSAYLGLWVEEDKINHQRAKDNYDKFKERLNNFRTER